MLTAAAAKLRGLGPLEATIAELGLGRPFARLLAPAVVAVELLTALALLVGRGLTEVSLAVATALLTVLASVALWAV